jgi:CheY-like chemotaxis protein
MFQCIHQKRRVMPRSKKKLLVVDDEVAVRVSLSQIFSGIGHSVRWASDGFSALQEIRRELPNIILCDLNMPGMSGFEFLSVVRRRFPSIQAVAISGGFAGDDIPDGVAADAYYEKGTFLGPLLTIVEGMAAELSSRQHPHALTPIWVMHNGNDRGGEPFVVINCPDCLRSFPQVLESVVCPVFATHCVHCNALIHYAIVPQVRPVPAASTLLGKAQEEMPTLSSLINLSEC